MNSRDLGNKFHEILHIGILGAMKEEIGEFEDHLNNINTAVYGDLSIISGELIIKENQNKSIYVSIAWSGWGKVSSARAATRLIATRYLNTNVDLILFTGVAGSLSPELGQWDIVIPDQVIQHDLDPRPIFKRFHIPSLKKDVLSPEKSWFKWIFNSISNNLNSTQLTNFRNLHRGLVGTGDKFLSNSKDIKKLKSLLPDLKAVEMEGAAVAQVSYQENIPWVIIRVISDSADDSAADEFSDFVSYYSKSSWYLIWSILINYENCPKFNID